jgi:hypothetical protein
MAAKSMIRAEDKLAMLETVASGMACGDAYKTLHADLMEEISD